MRTDRPLDALKSGAFRFALLLALVFACGSALLLWVVQRQIGSYATEATNSVLENEAAVLAGEYRQLGLSGLTDAMARHSGVSREAQFRYLLIDRRGKRLFGDLPSQSARLGWGRLDAIDDNSEPEALTQFGTHLSDGLTLVVATDNFDIDSMRRRLMYFTVMGGIAVTLFALGGSYMAGRAFLRRLDHVNRAVKRIIDGDYQERLPSIGVGPEFDDLAGNLNHMLDSNAAALDAVKQVSTAIAHDLRTPLTRLRQSLEEAREEVAIRAETIDDAINQVEEILDTFQALLRIGMLEGGVGRKRFTRVNLSEIMDRVHQAYVPAAEDAGHELVAAIDQYVFVEGDANLLAQLFSNLVENAIRHTPAGTRILSTLGKDDGTAIASVSDNGPGVTPSDSELLFRKFYRADSSRNTQGAGLGLSLVAAIADLHQASYRIAPVREGFCLELRFATLDDLG
jgi:signal transduction histidine kinase